MKRILSVILSLALLASLLIIPMSVSAGEGEPSAPTVSIKTEGLEYSDNNNLAKGITPYMFVTKDKQRTQITESTASFSDGNVGSGYEPNSGFKFSTDDKTFINGYKPYDSNDDTTVFDFTNPLLIMMPLSMLYMI